MSEQQMVRSVHVAPEAYAYEAEPPIDSSDKVWMERFGCIWPDAKDEQAWLMRMNQLVEIGSFHLLPHVSDEKLLHEQKRAVDARRQFFDELPAIKDDLFEGAWMSKHAAEVLVPLDRFVGVQRVLASRGIDGYNLILQNPRLLGLGASYVRQFIDEAESLGLDPDRLFRLSPRAVTYSGDALRKKVLAIRNLVKLTGAVNYTETAKELIYYGAATIGYSARRIEFVSTVIQNTLQAQTVAENNLSIIASVLISHPEALAVAVLRHRQSVTSLAGLSYQANYLNREIGSKRQSLRDLQAIIAMADPDDPIVQAYFRHYPADIDALRNEAWLHQENERSSQPYTPSLLWTGPQLLSSPKLSCFEAYQKTIPDGLTIDDEEFALLRGYVRQGKVANDQLRHIDVRHSQEEADQYIHEMELSRVARQALVARHMGLVIEIIEGSRRMGDRDEMLSIANAALSGYVMEEYQAVSGPEDREIFEREVVSVVMRALVGYAPAYQGRNLHDWEAAWRRSGEPSEDQYR
jgi:hypothetical protein